jgi:hypothetical protein
VIARLHNDGTVEHRDALLKALQLCERFINSNAASDEAYAVLKQEVAKAMLRTQQQVRHIPSYRAQLCHTAALQQPPPVQVHVHQRC